MKYSSNTEDDQYTTIRGIARSELRVKKSRFFGLATSVKIEEEFTDFINGVKMEFPNATHYCYAFVMGTEAKRLTRSSDAGEPANSAGKPILLAVESSGIHNVICVVVRYFGGVKLGIGGLIRAYGQTAKDCLNNAETVVRIPSVRLQIEMPYTCIGAVVNLVTRLRGKILSMDQAEKARAIVYIRRSVVPSLEESIKAINGDIVTSISK
ncbi:IMPACT family protein [Candidatus Poribacteria bacterium]